MGFFTALLAVWNLRANLFPPCDQKLTKLGDLIGIALRQIVLLAYVVREVVEFTHTRALAWYA